MTRWLAAAVAVMVCVRLGAAEIGWDGAAGDKPPADWELHASPQAKPTLRFDRGELAITVEANRFCHLDHALKGLDGTDEAPLRIDCAMAIDHGAAVAAHPALLALYWNPGAFIAVGLGDGGGQDQPTQWRNRSWLASASGGKIDRHPDNGWFYSGAAPGHVRLVVTSHVVTVYSSGDGWSWTRLGIFDRAAGFTGAPERLIVGRAWTADKDPKPHLDNDPPGAKADVFTYRFRELSVSTAPANVPASLMKNYDKKDTRDDTVDAITAPGTVKTWQVLGPLPPSDKHYGPEGWDAAAKLEPIEKLPWIPFTPGDSPTARIMGLHEIAKGGGADSVRYATATFSLDAPRYERFLFDGMRDVRLYVDGREICQDRRDAGEVAIDRLSAGVLLGKGEHRVVVRLGARQDGRALFCLRHENGDLLYHIALLKRLAIDFPDDSIAAAEQLEIARMWEWLGYQRESANALEELAQNPVATPDQVDQALVERARLHHELRDDTRLAQDVDELIKRWGDSSDAVSARLKAAHLWERLDQPAKAADELDQAATAAGADADRQIEIGIERARVHSRLGDGEGIIGDIRATAKRLPESDPRRSELLAQLALLELRAQKDPAPELAAAMANPSQTALRRIAALDGLRGDGAARLPVLKRLAAVASPTSLESPRVAYAEAAAAAGDAKTACEEYRAAIAQLPSADEPEVQARVKAGAGADAKALGALRAAFVRATVADSGDGRDLLTHLAEIQSGKAAKPLPSELHFATIGHFDDANWRCYEPKFQALFHPEAGKIDTSKAIEGKTWQAFQPQRWSNSAIDLMALYNGTNCCALLYAEFEADAATEADLSMGADDGLVLWLNGEKVHEDKDQRGLSPDSIKLPSMKIRKGLNTVLAMVQQGGGAWSFQFRIPGGSALGDAASALRMLDEHPESRAEIARLLASGYTGLAQSNSYGRAASLARALLRGFPDQAETQFATAWSWQDLARKVGDGQTVTDLPGWLDASPAALIPERIEPMRQLYLALGDTLGAWGAYEAGEQVLRGMLLANYDVGMQATVTRVIGDVHRRAGYARLAAADYAKAERMGFTDDNFLRDLHERMNQVRGLKGEKAPMDASFDANSVLRNAENAVEGKDFERAVTLFQRAIDDHGAALGLGADGRYASVSSYAAGRLRALGADGLAAYRAKFDSSAAKELEAADAAGTADAYEHAAWKYPLSSSAPIAFDRAADVYLDRGAWDLAGATVERILRDYPDAALDRGVLLAKGARAASLAGDGSMLARLSAELAKLGGQVAIGGKQVDPKAWAAEQAKALAASAPPEPALKEAAALVTFAVPPNAVHDMDRVSWIDGPVLCRPTVANGALYLHTLDTAFAVDLATGALRWQDELEFPTLRAPNHQPGYGGTPETQSAVSGGRALARALHGRTGVIEARDAATGALVWSTEGNAALASMTAVSSPAAVDGRAFAVFTDRNHEWLAALALTDGRLLWITEISPRRPTLPLIGDAEVVLDEQRAAPTVSGRDVFFATDLGTVLRLDAGTGAIAWVATYPRGQLNVNESQVAIAQLGTRAPTRVLVDDERAYFAPRDSLGVFAVSREDGRLAWSRELSQCRQIAGLAETAKGERRLVLQGGDLEAIDARTGERLWRWDPRTGDGPTWGTAALSAAHAFVATRGGITRVALADGATAEYRTWKELGWNGPILGNLLLTPAGMVAVGNGAAALIGGAHPKEAAHVSGGAVRDQPIACTDLPAAPPGGPLGPVWRIPGNVQSIDRPDGCAEGECFVRFDTSLARIDVAGRKVLWQTPISSDVRWAGYTKELVVTDQHFGLTAYDRATGAQRWYCDLGQSPLESLRDDGEERPVVVGEGYAVSYRYWWDRYVEVFSLAEGKRAGRFELGGGIIGATFHDGHLFTVFGREDGLFLDERDLANPGTSIKTYELQKRSDRDGATGMPGGIIGHGRNGSAWFDFATKTVKANPLGFFYGSVYREEDKLLAMVYTPKDNWVSAILDPATGQPLYQEVVGGGGDWANQLYEFHLNHGKAIRIEADRKGKNGVVCRNPADGKELWYVQGNEGWIRRNHAVVMLGKYAVILSTRTEGDFLYQEVDVDSGQVVASGRAPGWPAGDMSMPATAIAGQVVYGTSQGLFALAPTTADAATEPPRGAAPISVQSMSRLAILNAPGPMTIDGHLDDWKGVEPVELWQREDVRGDGSSPQPPRWTGPKDCAAGVRLCWDSGYVYAAVRVLDDRRVEPVPGSSLVTGDSVLVAIDPQEQQFRGSQPYVVGLAMVDGKPVMTTGGGVGGDGGEKPQMRAAIGADGVTYEVAIPWSQLRGDGGHRPGDQRLMRVGVMVVDRDDAGPPDAVEMGYGLAGGFDQSLWRPCYVGTEKELSATGMAFSLFGGRATWGRAGRLSHPRDRKKEPVEENWLLDALPKGATPLADGGDNWTWVKENPPPGAGQGHQSSINGGEHQHYFQDGPPLKLRPGDSIFVWVYLDPANPPSEVMVQFNKGGSWEHRAYWGDNKLEWGADGTISRAHLGPLPKAGGWVRLEIPPDAVGL